MVRKSLGRKKVIKMKKLEKIDDETYLQTVFSKRKANLLKKVNELCTLYDAHIVLIIFSPAKRGKVTSFGIGDFHYLFDPITSSSPSPHFVPDYLRVSERKDYVQFLNDKLFEVKDEKEKEEKNKKILRQNEKENSEKWWRSKYPKDLNLSEAIRMKEAFEAMKKEVHDITSHLFPTTNPNYYVGSSSNVSPPFATNDHMLPFGFDPMNGGFNDHIQIPNQMFEQAHPHYDHGPRFY